MFHTAFWRHVDLSVGDDGGEDVTTVGVTAGFWAGVVVGVQVDRQPAWPGLTQGTTVPVQVDGPVATHLQAWPAGAGVVMRQPPAKNWQSHCCCVNRRRPVLPLNRACRLGAGAADSALGVLQMGPAVREKRW